MMKIIKGIYGGIHPGCAIACEHEHFEKGEIRLLDSHQNGGEECGRIMNECPRHNKPAPKNDGEKLTLSNERIKELRDYWGDAVIDYALSLENPAPKNKGEKKFEEKVWDMIFDSFPSDMENLSTMLPDQALRLVRTLVKKLDSPASKNGEKIYISKVDPTIKRTLDSLVCIGCGKKLNICRQSCDWHKVPQQPAEEEKKPQEWEKEAVGKNVHSVYTLCLACRTWGINMPLDMVCGNCGNKTDQITYYDAETISQLLKEAEARGEEKGMEIAESGHICEDAYEARLNAFTEIQKFVEEKKKDKVQVPAACPDKMPGCLVYHFGYEETPEIKAYNQALSDLLSFIKDKQNKTND